MLLRVLHCKARLALQPSVKCTYSGILSLSSRKLGGRVMFTIQSSTANFHDGMCRIIVKNFEICTYYILYFMYITYSLDACIYLHASSQSLVLPATAILPGFRSIPKPGLAQAINKGSGSASAWVIGSTSYYTGASWSFNKGKSRSVSEFIWAQYISDLPQTKNWQM